MFETFGSRAMTSVHHVNCVTCFVLERFYKTYQSHSNFESRSINIMGRPQKETKLSVAERCKKYRDALKAEYRQADNLRKKLNRMKSKLNPDLEKERLKKQAEAKR